MHGVVMFKAEGEEDPDANVSSDVGKAYIARVIQEIITHLTDRASFFEGMADRHKDSPTSTRRFLASRTMAEALKFERAIEEKNFSIAWKIAKDYQFEDRLPPWWEEQIH